MAIDLLKTAKETNGPWVMQMSNGTIQTWDYLDSHPSSDQHVIMKRKGTQGVFGWHKGGAKHGDEGTSKPNETVVGVLQTG